MSLTIRVQKLQPVLDPVAAPDAVDLLAGIGGRLFAFGQKTIVLIVYLILFYEGNEGRPLDLYGLSRPVVECDDKVEEVGLAEVGRGLLLEVGATNARGNAGNVKGGESMRTFSRPAKIRNCAVFSPRRVSKKTPYVVKSVGLFPFC